jgi:hypothetical protein
MSGAQGFEYQWKSDPKRMNSKIFRGFLDPALTQHNRSIAASLNGTAPN